MVVRLVSGYQWESQWENYSAEMWVLHSADWLEMMELHSVVLMVVYLADLWAVYWDVR